MMTICADADELAARAADLFVQAAHNAVAARGRFTVALAGGSTPEAMYRLLAQAPRREQAPWADTFVFFGDERFVPPGDEQRSNVGMARRALLDHVPLPATGHVFAVDTTNAPRAEAAAHAYANTLAAFFGRPDPSGPPPVFDLVLLGLGDDGHTASLFPGMPALHVNDRWVVASPPGVLPPPVDRITLTFPVLNAARQVVFLVAGDKKAPALAAVLQNGADPSAHPAAGVRPANGTLTWLVDEAAARGLFREPPRPY